MIVVNVLVYLFVCVSTFLMVVLGELFIYIYKHVCSCGYSKRMVHCNSSFAYQRGP